MENRKLVLYISCSLDGYIAKPNDDLSFLGRVHKEGEDYGYQAFVETIDTVILGRKTYDWVMTQVDTFPHADKETYIVTRTERPPKDNIRFYTGSLKDLIEDLKKKPGKDIFCDGGADVVNVLLSEQLFDELIISVVPVLVGDGTRLFKNGRPEQGLKLMSAKAFDTGLVQLHYKTIND